MSSEGGRQHATSVANAGHLPRPDALPPPTASPPLATQAPPAVHRLPAALPPLLAFVAGAVDTAGFIAFAGLFVAHVTGNFVLLGAAIGEQVAAGTLMRVLVLPLYVAGVAIGWWILRAETSRGTGRGAARGPAALAWVEALALLACGVLGISRGWVWFAEDAAICCGVGAMGMQAMLGRAIKAPMTNVMTGNVTQLTVDLLEYRRAGGGRSPVVSGVLLVVAFAVGALAAGVAVPRIGLVFVLLPAGCLVGAGWALLPVGGRQSGERGG